MTTNRIKELLLRVIKKSMAQMDNPNAKSGNNNLIP